MNLCGDYGTLRAIMIGKYIFYLVLVIVPLIIMFMGFSDFGSLIISGDISKAKEKFKIFSFRLIAGFIIFLIPTVFTYLFSLVAEDSFFSELNVCFENANSETIKALEEAEKMNSNANVTGSLDVEENVHVTIKKTPKPSNNGGSENGGATGQGDFVKYNLTDAQIRSLASLALQEQGTVKGAAAEASLMANLFELKGSSYGTGADGLVNYVRNSGWFAHASQHMDNTSRVTSELESVIRKVLVDGKRTLPGYVDEHDCFSDISSATNNGSAINVKDRSNYKKNVTILHNRYGSTYTFYSFPDTNSDPFGYTSEQNRQRIGDDCYAFESL